MGLCPDLSRLQNYFSYFEEGAVKDFAICQCRFPSHQTPALVLLLPSRLLDRKSALKYNYFGHLNGHLTH